MSRILKDTIRYAPCSFAHRLSLTTFQGPLDGEDDWEYDPRRCPDGLLVCWYWSEDGLTELCATYQTAWRFSKTGGFEGPCLLWVP